MESRNVDAQLLKTLKSAIKGLNNKYQEMASEKLSLVSYLTNSITNLSRMFEVENENEKQLEQFKNVLFSRFRQKYNLPFEYELNK